MSCHLRGKAILFYHKAKLLTTKFESQINENFA